MAAQLGGAVGEILLDECAAKVRAKVLGKAFLPVQGAATTRGVLRISCQYLWRRKGQLGLASASICLQ